jgi:hypothetical protein
MTDAVISEYMRQIGSKKKRDGILHPRRTIAWRRRQEMLAAIEAEYGGELSVIQREHALNVVRLMERIEAIDARRQKGEVVSDKTLAFLIREQSRELAAISGD